MDALTRVEGVAAPLLRDNIDTDILIPSRDITSPSREGFGAKLFAPWRFVAGAGTGGVEEPGFVLNRAPYRQARILISGRNFGCGSSREMAVWALVQFGIRCVIAPSFGAIFRNNCIRNAVLPVELPEAAVEQLAALAEQTPAGWLVDVQRCCVLPPDGSLHAFSMAEADRDMLLTGLDAIARTLQDHGAAIDAFEQVDRQQRPWAWGL